MRRRVCIEAIGKRRVVIQFDFSGGPKQSYWLLIEHTDVSVCLKSPGFDINVVVSANIMAFYRVWLGRVSLPEALRRQQVRLDGVPAEVRAFSSWFSWSPMAETVRAALVDRQKRSNDYHSVKLVKRRAG